MHPVALRHPSPAVGTTPYHASASFATKLDLPSPAPQRHLSAGSVPRYRATSPPPTCKSAPLPATPAHIVVGGLPSPPPSRPRSSSPESEASSGPPTPTLLGFNKPSVTETVSSKTSVAGNGGGSKKFWKSGSNGSGKSGRGRRSSSAATIKQSFSSITLPPVSSPTQTSSILPPPKSSRQFGSPSAMSAKQESTLKMPLAGPPAPQAMFPDLPSHPSNRRIKLLSADQYAVLYETHASGKACTTDTNEIAKAGSGSVRPEGKTGLASPPPTPRSDAAKLDSSAPISHSSILFPYLHGADRIGTAQANYFSETMAAQQAREQAQMDERQRQRERVGTWEAELNRLRKSGKGGAVKKPRFRGLTTISADPPVRTVAIRHSPSRSRDSTSTYAASEFSGHNLSSYTSSESSFDSDGRSSQNSWNDVSKDPESQDHNPVISLPVGAHQGHRGKTVPSPSLLSSLMPEDILAPVSLNAQRSKSSDSTKTVMPGDGPTVLPSKKLSVKDEPQSTFLTPKLSSNVNLRNFFLQPSQYARLSDIVVFSSEGVDGEGGQRALEVAERCLEASDAESGRLKETEKRDYNVFVVADSFDKFERNYPDLVAVDSLGRLKNKIDFFEREREEMRILTRKSEIGFGVWLGNNADVPSPSPPSPNMSFASLSSLSSYSLASSGSCPDLGGSEDGKCSSDGHRPPTSRPPRDLVYDPNPDHFSILVECHDGIQTAPDVNTLADVSNSLYAIEDDQRLAGFDSYVDEEIPIGHGKALRRWLKVHGVEHLGHMECISTSQVLNPHTTAHLDHLANHLVSLVCFLRDQAVNKMRKVLLHCADGYTETSVLALCYVMYNRRCSLPDAYTYLQNECGRSFFVYSQDLDLLKLMEIKLNQVVRSEIGQQGKLCPPEGMEVDEEGSDNEVVCLRDIRVRNGPEEAMEAILAQEAGAAYPSPRSSFSSNSSIRSESISMISDGRTHPWFYDSRFDGHFPSRILPFLYLGNLNHACNPLMLHELGITHVVSVGESALTPPQQRWTGGGANAFASPSRRQQSAPRNTNHNSLLTEQKEGRISVLEVKGVADDGIDSIVPHISKAVKYIEEAERQGGKVLVHCRVGVSRSATIVIAFMMKRLGLDLPSAYLLTRSRRLNILIQPTVLLFYELWTWEGWLQEQRAKAEAESGIPATHLARLSWSFLAREVATLNSKYLC